MCGISSNSKTLSLKPVVCVKRFSFRPPYLISSVAVAGITIKPILTSGKLLFITILFNCISVIENAGSVPVISDIHKKVPTGTIIHLFPRYGYLSLSMRVVPRNDTQSWVFLEPVRDVFVDSTIKIEERTFTSSDNRLPIHNEFHIDLCEDMSQLVQAYFRRFKIEGLDKPWQAFAGGWRTPSLSKYFGIDPTFVVGNYRYMLVRVLMVRNSGKAEPFGNITLTPEFRDQIEQFTPRNDLAMYHFANNVGTHYVHSYVAGNSVYQVFVYDPAGFEAVKRRLSEFDRQKPSHMSYLPNLLPLWVKQIGKLFILNSSPQVAENIRQALTVETFKNIAAPNIFKLHDNPTLVKNVEILLKDEPSGILGIDLRTVDIIFPEKSQKRWFVQSLKHKMELWEVNFQ